MYDGKKRMENEKERKKMTIKQVHVKKAEKERNDKERGNKQRIRHLLKNVKKEEEKKKIEVLFKGRKRNISK